MIEFLKILLKKVNFKSDNKDLNKFNKIIYSIIVLCAIIFIGFIIFWVIKQWPSFMDSLRYYWNESTDMVKNLNK